MSCKTLVFYKISLSLLINNINSIRSNFGEKGKDIFLGEFSWFENDHKVFSCPASVCLVFSSFFNLPLTKWNSTTSWWVYENSFLHKICLRLYFHSESIFLGFFKLDLEGYGFKFWRFWEICLFPRAFSQVKFQILFFLIFFFSEFEIFQVLFFLEPLNFSWNLIWKKLYFAADFERKTLFLLRLELQRMLGIFFLFWTKTIFKREENFKFPKIIKNCLLIERPLTSKKNLKLDWKPFMNILRKKNFGKKDKIFLPWKFTIFKEL